MPNKPRPKPTTDWPMYWHKSGYWAKTVGFKKWYFGARGSADSPPEFDDEALADYNANIVSIRAGCGKISHNGARVSDVVAAFLDSRQQLVDRNELAPRTLRDYAATGRRMVAHFGKTTQVAAISPEALTRFRNELAAGVSHVTLANRVRFSRVILRYAFESGMIDSPIRFGDFKEPARARIRGERNAAKREHGLKMFEAEQIRAILDADYTPAQLRAMVLLGINCAYGNKDCSELRRGDIVEREGRHWLEVERVKTQVGRRCPLWPETVNAIEAIESERPRAANAEHNDRVFLTTTGLPWVRDVTSNTDEIATQFGKLLGSITDPTTGRAMKRPGLSFYALRHTVETIGDRCKDPHALNLILGHVDNTMAGVYRERIDDDRLLAVTDYVRAWLFPE